MSYQHATKSHKQSSDKLTPQKPQNILKYFQNFCYDTNCNILVGYYLK